MAVTGAGEIIFVVLTKLLISLGLVLRKGGFEGFFILFFVLKMVHAL